MKKIFVSIVIFFTSFSANAADQIYIKIGEANIKKSLLAMPPFLFLGNPKLNPGHVKTGKELYDTVYNDLDVSSYFYFINPTAFLEDPGKTGLKPKPQDPNGFSYDNWKPLGTEFLIRAGYSVADDKIQLEGYLYHVSTAKMIFGKQYESDTKGLRKIAHSFANDVLEKLTGQRGMFESQVVVSVAKEGENFKEIYVMDWDGQSLRKITNHRSIAISPAWSTDNKLIAYTAYTYHPKDKTRNADLFLLNLATGDRSILSSRKGINSGATFIPDSDELLATISSRGNPDIFRVTPSGHLKERLTSGPAKAMNVEPAVSPDGKTVAFSSDRSGRPMIYVMNMKEPERGKREVKRIVFAGWYNATPTWSPDSQRIAFAGYDKDLKHFDIFSMKPDGTDLIRLTTAKKIGGKKYSNNEDPTYSPDGRHVMFISDRTGHKQVYIVNADGSNERRITFDKNDYHKPKWSWPEK